MSHMDLFIRTPELVFTKIAGIEVDEDPAKWTRQVLAELYKALPDIAEYSANVVFYRRDDKQGYALGGVLLENGTDSALAATRVGGREPVKAVIPVVIRGYQLLPFDVFMGPGGHMFPLTPDRLREALFRPDTFEQLTADWGDASLYNLFYPPGRLGGSEFGGGVGSGLGGSGGTNYIMGPGMKYSSGEDYFMLDSVIPTMLRPDIDAVAGILRDAATKIAATENAVMLMALAKIASAEEGALATASPLYKAAANIAGSDVVQVGYDPDLASYWMKSASRAVYEPRAITYLDRGEMLKFAGEEITQKVDVDGTVTLAPAAVTEPAPDAGASKWKIVEEPGIYKVRTEAGKEMMGWVLPNLLDLDGTRMPTCVFTNGATSMVQDQIVGARVATGVDLPVSPVKGVGIFYCAGQGGIEATIPLRIIGQEAGMNGSDNFVVETLTGGESKVCVTDGLAGMKALGGEFFIPRTAKFMAVDDAPSTPLVADLSGLNKTAAAILAPVVQIRAIGDEYTLSFQNAPKLASAGPYRALGHDDAVFALALAGLPADLAEAKLAYAERDGLAQAAVIDIGLFSDVLSSARADSRKLATKIASLKTCLVKEAAALPNALTVDAVLSLGFINPENVRLFVSRLPYLEKALSMLCEMVLASRLGLSVIPEGAASRSARALDGVIAGLRGLALFDVGQSE